MSQFRKAKVLERDDPDSSLHCCERLLEKSLQANFTYGTGLLLVNLGYLEITTSRYSKALDYFRRSFPYLEVTPGNRHLVVNAYIGMGCVGSLQGNYKQAIRYYDSAVNKGISGRQPVQKRFQTALAYSNMAALYIRLNQPGPASKYLIEAEQICRKERFDIMLPNVLINRMDLYVSIGQYDQALNCYKEGMGIVKRLNLKEQEMSLNCSMAEMLLKQGKPEDVKRYLGTINYNSSQYSDYYFRFIPGYILSKACYSQKQYSKAEYHLLHIIRIAAKSHIQDGLMDAHRVLSETYEQMGRYREALVQHKIYQQLNDSLVSREKLRDINELEVRYRTAEKDRELIAKEGNILKARSGEQRKTAAIWIASLAILLLVSILIFIRHRQASRLKELAQQKQLDILQATMDGEEAERQRVGLELHDGVSGFLSAIKMHLVTLRVTRKEVAADEHFIMTVKLTDEAADELRKTAHNLVPSSLINSGVGEAVALFCERVSTPGGLAIEVQQHGDPVRLAAAMELIIYRSVQELVHNIIKHAQATLTLVSLSWQEHLLLIAVEDNGTGIRKENKYGIGLENMRKRIVALKGNMEINSVPMEGTSVYIEVPVH